MKIASKLLLGFSLTAGFGAFAAGTTLVVPNANLTSSGKAQNNLSALSGSVEYQELPGFGQFPGIRIVITGLSLRAASTGTAPVTFK